MKNKPNRNTTIVRLATYGRFIQTFKRALSLSLSLARAFSLSLSRIDPFAINNLVCQRGQFVIPNNLNFNNAIASLYRRFSFVYPLKQIGLFEFMMKMKNYNINTTKAT